MSLLDEFLIPAKTVKLTAEHKRKLQEGRLKKRRELAAETLNDGASPTLRPDARERGIAAAKEGRLSIIGRDAVIAANKARAGKLKPIDSVIISLSMEGYKQCEIAQKLNRRDGYINRRLQLPAVKAEFNRRLAENDERFLKLKEKAVDAFRDALDDGNPVATLDVRLAAADKWFKLNGYGDKAKKGTNEPSLEDIVKGIIVNVQVNNEIKP